MRISSYIRGIGNRYDFYPVLGHVLTPIQGEFNPRDLHIRIPLLRDTEFARDSFDLVTMLHSIFKARAVRGFLLSAVTSLD